MHIQCSIGLTARFDLTHTSSPVLEDLSMTGYFEQFSSRIKSVASIILPPSKQYINIPGVGTLVPTLHTVHTVRTKNKYLHFKSTFPPASLDCIVGGRRFSVTNYIKENFSPTFQLDVSVVIRMKVKKACSQSKHQQKPFPISRQPSSIYARAS